MIGSVDREGVIEFTRELVRIESVNRPREGLGEQAAAEAVVARMRSFGWDPVVQEVAPGRPNVICVVEGDRPGPTLMFEGHTDVVTAGDPSAWTHDPFGAEVLDGRLYGRGSADMKSGLAAIVYATRAVQQAGPFPGRVLIGALCDEEEMMIGVKHFVAQGWCEGIDAVISAEPEAGEICAVSKGAIRLRIDALGRMAHAAMPDEGANAVAALAGVTVALVELEARTRDRLGSFVHLGEICMTPTMMSGGSIEQLNVIPADAVMGVDVRTTPAVDHAWLIDEIRAVLTRTAASSGVALELTVIDDRPSVETPLDAPVVRALAAAHQQVTDRAPIFGGVPGTTDGTILWRDGGIDSVVYGPGGKWIAHQVDEYVELADIVEAAEVFALTVRNFLGG